MCSLVFALLPGVLVGATPATQHDNASEPLEPKPIVYLDAAYQVQTFEIRAGSYGDQNREPDKTLFTNIAAALNPATQSRHFALAVLHGFRFDASSNWVGGGSPSDPYALRFNAGSSYVEGNTQIELPEVTLEAWAYVEGVGNAPEKGTNARGATLIGNDFGEGGVALLIAQNGSPLILNGTSFTPVPAETPFHRWQQVVATFTVDKARVYVNGELMATLPMQRVAQKNHVAKYMLGAARHETNDFVEADGLRGLIAIARVYNRALSAAQVLHNFEADRGRFNIPTVATAEPVRSTPAPQVPGLPSSPLSNRKWDYFNNPPFISGTGPAGWPSNARQAFDGYPSRIDQPYLRNCWRCEVKPNAPAEVTINYRRPVAVTRYVHWYCEPAAWKSAEILASPDGENWQSLQKFDDLPPDYPQYLAIDKPILARQYKLIVKSLAPSASTSLVTQEIETNYGPTIGNITTDPPPVQTEATTLRVHVASPDASIEGARLRLIVANGAVEGASELMLPAVAGGGEGTVAFSITPQSTGIIPTRVELLQGDVVVDQRSFPLRVSPKLVFSKVSPQEKRLFDSKEGLPANLVIKGVVTNQGHQPAITVRIGLPWESQPPAPEISLGDLAPGQSAPFELYPAHVPSGDLAAKAAGGVRTEIYRPIIRVIKDWGGTASTSAAHFHWQTGEGPLRVDFQNAADTAVAATSLQVLANEQPTFIANVGPTNQPFVAALPNGMLAMSLEETATNEICLHCRVRAIQDDPLQPSTCDFELRLKVERASILFRPHIDWYNVAHGPNYPQLANGHNSATRMLCVQTTDNVTLSVVPDTDNLDWGFTKENEIVLKFHVVTPPKTFIYGRPATQPAGTSPFRPITYSPSSFKLTFSVRKGDWWDAYRHVVQDIFKFEQPRQWAMPITQTQMLTARFPLRPEVWSEKWQVVRSHPGVEFFYNFYGLTYNIPALYSWYLVSDDTSALDRAQKDVAFLLNVQELDGPVAGAWFSQYCVEGSPPRLVGRDQAWNRWVMPHATGTSAKTLLWYWEASGKKDGRVFAAAKRGCDWLLKTQRADGAWTYAFDLQGKPVSELSGAGQIWCTWALWKMYQYTGDEKYAQAARRSRDAFKKTFMDVHRYEGYWEDVSGAGGKVTRSWEGYEPAIACLVFADMGDKELAIEAGKDAATWSWTRVTSTRQYETAYGETTEQSLCGPSQAQSPMIAVGLHQIYELTGDKLWSDFSGAIKAFNFAADPDQAYGMVATGGWDDPLTGVIGPPYENTRPMVTPNNSRGDEYGRQIWNNWCTDQFAWLALEWLVREANVRAPDYVKIDPNTYRGTVLGSPGRVKMPEEKCDVQGIDHIDINWVGYQNDDRYVLLIMNHHEKTTVMVRPHEAHLGVYPRLPQFLVGRDSKFEEAKVTRRGVQYEFEIPDRATALLVWDAMK